MNARRNEAIALAVAVLLLCSLLVLNSCQKEQPQGIGLGAASYISDLLTFPYNIAMDKTLKVTGVTTMTGGAYIPGGINLSGGLAVGGNITMSNGAILNSKGAVTVTDDLVLSGVVVNSGGDFRVNDGALITGSLAVAGNVNDSNTMLRLNDNTLVTGTLGVSSQVVAANGVRVTGGVTVAASGDLVLAGGNIWDDSDDVDILDNLQVGGVTTVDYGLSVGENLTMSNGALINAKGAVTITDDVDLSGDFTMNVGGRIIQANGDVTVADGIDITGITYAHDDIQALNDVRISDFLILEDVELSGIYTVTGWITPTLSYQRLGAEAWVTPTVNSGCVPGQVWLLYNWSANKIFLADSGALILSDDYAMEQHDTLFLICNAGGNWAELARSNN